MEKNDHLRSDEDDEKLPPLQEGDVVEYGKITCRVHTGEKGGQVIQWMDDTGQTVTKYLVPIPGEEGGEKGYGFRGPGGAYLLVRRLIPLRRETQEAASDTAIQIGGLEHLPPRQLREMREAAEEALKNTGITRAFRAHLQNLLAGIGTAGLPLRSGPQQKPSIANTAEGYNFKDGDSVVYDHPNGKMGKFFRVRKVPGTETLTLYTTTKITGRGTDVSGAFVEAGDVDWAKVVRKAA